MALVRLLLVALAVGCSSENAPLPPPSVCVIESAEDGEVVERSIEELDERGRTRVITSERLPPAPGVEDSIFTFEYDDEGRPISVEMRQGAIMTRRDATYEPDRVFVRYNGGDAVEYTLEDGRVVSARGSEGSDQTARYAYDEEGRVIEIEEHSLDADTREPVRLLVQVLSFDPRGRPTRAERTTMYGTTPETTTRFTWSYEDLPDGVIITRMIDGRPTIARFHSDARGRLLSAAHDEDGDGTFDWLASYDYEDASNTMSAISSRPSHGTERGFVSRGACEAPRMPEESARAPTPMHVGDGRIYIAIPGRDILGV
jgi:YD repeat-containing protein